MSGASNEGRHYLLYWRLRGMQRQLIHTSEWEMFFRNYVNNTNNVTTTNNINHINNLNNQESRGDSLLSFPLLHL